MLPRTGQRVLQVHQRGLQIAVFSVLARVRVLGRIGIQDCGEFLQQHCGTGRADQLLESGFDLGGIAHVAIWPQQPLMRCDGTKPHDAMVISLASETPAMEAYRVSRAVNTSRSNCEELLQ